MLSEVRLSPPALETLAVVVYRQPVLRAEIEAIRGVQCGEILRQLMDRDLVRIAGRSEELGRPFLYGTTRYFLQVFGLRHLEELPRPELRREPLPQSSSPGKQYNLAQESSNQPHSIDSGGNLDVKTSFNTLAAEEDVLVAGAATPWEGSGQIVAFAREEDEDADFEDEDEEDDDDEDLDDEEDDEDFEDDEWEEVEDDEEELDEETDEDEDEDWDDEDEDWDDEEDDEDWDDDEEDEEEEEEGKEEGWE
jgi:segregation and condensation protein B